MKKTDQPAWVKRILKLLEQAKAKDPDFEHFGAHSHQYRLSAPASEKAVQKFEEKQGICLPEEYRDFLMLVGNGGAGPYYGLYGTKVPERNLLEVSLPKGNIPEDRLPKWRLEKKKQPVRTEPLIYPKMSDADWEKAAGTSYPHIGVLPIGDQGCTLMTGLMLDGPYRGQVVYYDEDLCEKPFFVREKGFLAWYERWLREVIAGYDDGETGFGLNVDGNPDQLMELYEQTDDPEEKTEIIDSYYKFEALPGRQQTYFKQSCAQESNMEVRMYLIRMMAHFQVPGMATEIETLWEYGAYAEAVSLIRGSTPDVIKTWYEKIFAILPKLRGDGFRDACYTLWAAKDYPDVHAGRFKEALMREDLDTNDRIVLFYCIRDMNKKEDVLDHICDVLSTQEDPYLLLYAVQSMDGVQDQRLQEICVKLLDRYRTHENAKIDYKGSQMVLKGGSCAGANRPEGQLVGSLMLRFDQFGLDYRGAWKLLMDNDRWKEWKQQNGFMQP